MCLITAFPHAPDEQCYICSPDRCSLPQRLVSSAEPDSAARLKAAYQMLTGEMGERFKMWAMLPATARPILDRFPPAGFTA